MRLRQSPPLLRDALSDGGWCDPSMLEPSRTPVARLPTEASGVHTPERQMEVRRERGREVEDCNDVKRVERPHVDELSESER